MHVDLDLFGTPAIPTLASASAFVTEAEQTDLIARIDAASLNPFKFQGWLGKRMTRSYGWSYDFETGKFERTDPLPDWLGEFRTRAARFAGLEADELVQALLIRYDPGAGIGWHKDRPVFEHILGISLGHAATMRFRRRVPTGFERRTAPLDPRSIYHLAGEIRHDWEHSIAPIEQPRWSITFRSLSERGQRARR